MIIVPAILSDSLEVIQAQIDRVVKETTFKRVQIDIIDAEFADEITISPIDLLEIDLKSLEIDIHLMTNEPINDVIECSQIPGIKTIIAQIEHMDKQIAFIERVKGYGIDAGFSLDLYTQPDAIEEECLEKLALIQVMGNKAGLQGEEFKANVILPKITQIKKIFTGPIAVDIGMNPKTEKQVTGTGAEMVVVGSYLWNSPNLREAIDAFSK